MDIENSDRKRYAYWNRERYESFTIEWQNRTAQPECRVRELRLFRMDFARAPRAAVARATAFPIRVSHESIA